MHAQARMRVYARFSLGARLGPTLGDGARRGPTLGEGAEGGPIRVGACVGGGARGNGDGVGVRAGAE
jgi:hypothetical protein